MLKMLKKKHDWMTIFSLHLQMLAHTDEDDDDDDDDR